MTFDVRPLETLPAYSRNTVAYRPLIVDEEIEVE